MGLAQRKHDHFTVEQYLKIERSIEERNEYLDGEIYQMAGESGAHGDISVNLTMALGGQLKNTPCRVRSKDTKVRSSGIVNPRVTTKGMFSYPDVVVICGAPQYHDKLQDIILNPSVIIEVLSESTEQFDRGEKFERYRQWNPTLTDYILVSQDKPLIEHFIRQTDESWKLYDYRGLETSFAIDSINCSLSLADVYDRIEFAADFADDIIE